MSSSLANGIASLERAQAGQSNTNDQIVRAAFAAQGVEVSPREDVFTYGAWQALGRQVRKGEKSVKVRVWLKVEREDHREEFKLRTACLFHVSQTDAKGEEVTA